MTDPEALYASVGEQLLEAGVAGVVAMAYSVAVETATRFMARFYEAFVAGRKFSAAVTLARRQLWSEPLHRTIVGDVAHRDWVIPMAMASAPLRLARSPAILTSPPGSPASPAPFLGTLLPTPPASGFVGRDGPILVLERALYQRSVVHLRGMADVGKTQLAIEFARWQAATGNADGPLAYVSLSACGTPESLKQLLNGARPAILILDDADEAFGEAGTPGPGWLAEDRAGLVALVATLCREGGRVLIVTRQAHLPGLGQDEPVIVDGLIGSDAADLVARHGVAVPVAIADAEAGHALQDVLRATAGIPLAIECLAPEAARETPAEVLRILQSGLPEELSPAAWQPLGNVLGAAFDRLEPEIRRHLSGASAKCRDSRADGIPMSSRTLAGSFCVGTWRMHHLVLQPQVH